MSRRRSTKRPHHVVGQQRDGESLFRPQVGGFRQEKPGMDRKMGELQPEEEDKKGVIKQRHEQSKKWVKGCVSCFVYHAFATYGCISCFVYHALYIMLSPTYKPGGLFVFLLGCCISCFTTNGSEIQQKTGYPSANVTKFRNKFLRRMRLMAIG